MRHKTHTVILKKKYTHIYIYTYKSIKFFYFLISVPPPVHRRPTTNCANPRGTIGRPTMTSHRPPIIVIVITGVIAPPLAAITMKIKSSLISCYESASFSVHILFLHPSRSSTTMEQKKKRIFNESRNNTTTTNNNNNKHRINNSSKLITNPMDLSRALSLFFFLSFTLEILMDEI